jgi:hypothetical protein
MISNFKLFESDENYEVLGTNESSWSWEYDSNTRTAQILLDRNDDSLYLKIREVHTKSGLGKGQRASDLVFVKIGDLQKADLAIVRTLLKKHAHDRTRSGHGFSQFWQDEEGNKLNLTDLLKMHKPEKITQKMKYLKSIDTFEEKDSKTKNDIELVKYSERSYALFGKDTKKIKDELFKIGCKYNKFLTDPLTKEKKPGWILSNSMLDKVKKIL